MDVLIVSIRKSRDWFAFRRRVCVCVTLNPKRFPPFGLVLTVVLIRHGERGGTRGSALSSYFFLLLLNPQPTFEGLVRRNILNLTFRIAFAKQLLPFPSSYRAARFGLRPKSQDLCRFLIIYMGLMILGSGLALPGTPLTIHPINNIHGTYDSRGRGGRIERFRPCCSGVIQQGQDI